MLSLESAADFDRPYTSQEFQRVKRRHSTFQPARFSIERLGPNLSECSFIRQVLQTKCSERLLQSRYYDIIGEQTISIPRTKHAITFSIINSIMTNLVKEQGTNVCTGGRVQLYLAGDPESANQQVVNEATVVNFRFPRQCGEAKLRQAKLIFVPLNIRWIQSPRAVERAKTQGRNFKCSSECPEGHAQALLIDTEDKTIEFYEPNGKNVPWYKPISSYLTRLFKHDRHFSSYTVLDYAACLPNRGVQQIAQRPQCAYFSNLYAAVRLLCPEIEPAAIIIEFIALKQGGVLNLLQRFHCFLVEYAQSLGLFQAVEQLPRFYTRVLNKLLNFERNQQRNQQRRPKQYYESMVQKAETVAFVDILSAIKILNSVDREL